VGAGTVDWAVEKADYDLWLAKPTRERGKAKAEGCEVADGDAEIIVKPPRRRRRNVIKVQDAKCQGVRFPNPTYIQLNPD